MNVGGFHIFAGIFFVVLSVVISTFWVIAAYWLWVKLRYGFYRYELFFFNLRQRRAQKADPDFVVDENLRPLAPRRSAWNPKLFRKACAFFLIIHFYTYGIERITYLGNDNLHYKAKEYWVAGQVFSKTRRTLGWVLHPENPILQPYTLVQKLIYRIGRHYLPADDGEQYVWYGSWFLYPYAPRIKLPYGVKTEKASPKMVKLIEEFYTTMKEIDNLSIGDKDIYRKSLFDFPHLASYYSLFDSFSSGKFNNGGVRVRTSMFYSGRLLDVLAWLDHVAEAWNREGLREKIWKKDKYLACTLQLTTLELLQDIALSLPSRGSFSCDHWVIDRLKQEYEKIMSADPSVNSLLNLGRRKGYSKKAYRSFVLSARGSSGKYLIADVCKQEISEKSKILDKEDFCGRYTVESVFDDELRPLLPYFAQRKDKELFCGGAMFDYSFWQKAKRDKGEAFTVEEEARHNLILQGIDELCLDNLLLKKNYVCGTGHYCDIFLDRYLYLLAHGPSENVAPILFEQEKIMEILELAYECCEYKREDISRVREWFKAQTERQGG
ncbi:MAG: hypothetical protein CSA20_04450 [Deltaproteobacteria bacterium]|nr:MAG: hypothetical protein CSA20_04450 [Deltaproteobacteria bacterium]